MPIAEPTKSPRPPHSPWHPGSARPIWLGLFAAVLACGCSVVEPRAAAGPPPATAIVASHHRDSLVSQAKRTRAEGRKLERRGQPASVDRYYKAVVLATAAMEALPIADDDGDEELAKIRDLYNESLGDCLRAAQKMERIDSRVGLSVNGPMGMMTVPIAHLGFVWAPEDFGRLVAPQETSRIRPSRPRHIDPGLGAPVGVERPNPRASASDEFLPRVAVFNATAALRPDLEAWLGSSMGQRPPADVLELRDPLRERSIAFASRVQPLAADLEIANVRFHEMQDAIERFAVAGFTYPEQVLDRAGILMLEPFQPGKIPVIFIHGLLADPYIFKDIITALQHTPGFLDRFQIWTYRYPTGATILRVASILRREIHDATAALDPLGTDPGIQNMALVGYSLGGILARLQVSSSGDEIWRLMSNRPLEDLRLSQDSRSMAEDLFFFEPVPNVRQVIFLATPHGGTSPALRGLARFTSRFIRRPDDTKQFIAEADDANPGALTETARHLPSSIEAIAQRGPLLPTIRRLPLNPQTSLETIAGAGPFGPHHSKGDLVVPHASSHLVEADAEFWVRAVHNNIYRKDATIAAIRRLLIEKADAEERVPHSAFLKAPSNPPPRRRPGRRRARWGGRRC